MSLTLRVVATFRCDDGIYGQGARCKTRAQLNRAKGPQDAAGVVLEKKTAEELLHVNPRNEINTRVGLDSKLNDMAGMYVCKVSEWHAGHGLFSSESNPI